MKLLILSPHRDDAAFSCSYVMLAALRASIEVTVLTLYTISDYAPFLEMPAKLAADEPARIAHISAIRAAEDEVFSAAIETRAGGGGVLAWSDLHWPEAPLRLEVATEQVLLAPLDQAGLAAEAARLAAELQAFTAADLILSPLSLGGHVDHRITRQAAEAVFPTERLGYYEDLPYACYTLFSDLTPPGTAAYDLPVAEAAGLRRAMAAPYASQIAPELMDRMESYSAGKGYTERLYAPPSLLYKLTATLAAGSNRSFV